MVQQSGSFLQHLTPVSLCSELLTDCRNVDQSDPETQLQMMDYVQDLSGLEQIGDEPGLFWLRDFRQLAESNQTEGLIGFDLDSLSFKDQVNLALTIPQLRKIYGRDIVRDPVSGNITASRALWFLRDFDPYVFLVLSRLDCSGPRMYPTHVLVSCHSQVPHP